MPEYIVALILSACLGSLGWLTRKIDSVENRLDEFELKVASEYVTKAELFRALDRIESSFLRVGDNLQNSLIRVEDKLDAHVSEDRERIQSIIRKYRLNTNQND